jgi:hypothetical protein
MARTLTEIPWVARNTTLRTRLALAATVFLALLVALVYALIR